MPCSPIFGRQHALFTGITAVIGTWTVHRNLYRRHHALCQGHQDSHIRHLTGLLGGNILMIVCGAIAAIAMENSDLTVILLGFGPDSQPDPYDHQHFTTNAANLYSTSLNLSMHLRWSARKMLHPAGPVSPGNPIQTL